MNNTQTHTNIDPHVAASWRTGRILQGSWRYVRQRDISTRCTHYALSSAATHRPNPRNRCSIQRADWCLGLEPTSVFNPQMPAQFLWEPKRRQSFCSGVYSFTRFHKGDVSGRTYQVRVPTSRLRHKMTKISTSGDTFDRPDRMI